MAHAKRNNKANLVTLFRAEAKLRLSKKTKAEERLQSMRFDESSDPDGPMAGPSSRRQRIS